MKMWLVLWVVTQFSPTQCPGFATDAYNPTQSKGCLVQHGTYTQRTMEKEFATEAEADKFIAASPYKYKFTKKEIKKGKK